METYFETSNFIIFPFYYLECDSETFIWNERVWQMCVHSISYDLKFLKVHESDSAWENCDLCRGLKTTIIWVLNL